MTLRKITVGNSVRYIPRNEKTKDRKFKQNTKKAGSLPKKQKKSSTKQRKICQKRNARRICIY